MPENVILNKLNQDQQKAVTITDGPIIILAGAGSGKTRVLVHRVLYLILEKNIRPGNILMVTFTNKAAGEMLERIMELLHEYRIKITKADRPTVGTFHALCAKILRHDGRHSKIPPNFVIFDTHDQEDAVKTAMRQLDFSVKEIRPKAVLHTISQAKNELIGPKSYTTFARGFFQEAVAKIYPVYQKILKESYALDFDDLLIETIRLLRTHDATREYYQEKFRYIMIDEYQDTNHAQYVLTRLLSRKHENICVVGDFSQSIYSFRGADFRNLEKFKNDFSQCTTISLSQNYRSTQNILDAAYSVISKNTTHPVLSLWTENAAGDDIQIYQAENEQNEAEFIIDHLIQDKKKDPNFSLSNYAVLYRTNAQSRSLEEVFLHHGLRYILVGGVRFYERREIKDVLSLVSFLANPKNSIARNRIEKLGKRRAEKFFEYAQKFIEEKKVETLTTLEILDEAIGAIDYLALYDEKDPDDQARLENIKELRSVAIAFSDLHQFLENVALVEQEYMPDKIEGEEKPEAITIMTLHAAKGLEFKTVFIVGMEEGIFPHTNALLDNNEVEEERRLCYVGITRAKNKLILTCAKRRLFFGQRTSNTMSRFIFELPEKVLQKNLLNSEDMLGNDYF